MGSQDGPGTPRFQDSRRQELQAEGLSGPLLRSARHLLRRGIESLLAELASAPSHSSRQTSPEQDTGSRTPASPRGDSAEGSPRVLEQCFEQVRNVNSEHCAVSVPCGVRLTPAPAGRNRGWQQHCPGTGCQGHAQCLSHLLLVSGSSREALPSGS